MTKRFLPLCFMLMLFLFSTDEIPGQALIFLDFDADWQQRLQEVATDAAVPLFDDAERTQIEQQIATLFETAFEPFDVSIETTRPGRSHEIIDFGATTTSANLLGSAQLDFRNFVFGAQRVFTRNFARFIESDEPRAQQLDELAVTLAGTAIHEQGHAFGLRHHAAYGTSSITPDNYHDTGGAQNQHFSATGSTGLNEEEREVPRTWSDWSLLSLESAFRLTPNPLTTQEEAGDAGGQPPAAQLLDLTSLPISGADAGLVSGRLMTEDDIDIYAFEVIGPSRLTAELWSDEWFGSMDDFNGSLSLLDEFGTELSLSEGLFYSGDTFGSGTDHGDDAFLINVLLPDAGTYYLQVASIGDSGGTASGDYLVLFGSTLVPEPGLMTLLMALPVLGCRRWSLVRGCFRTRDVLRQATRT